MIERLDKKLQRIADIWDHYIWNYNFCSSKIRFNEDLKTNYFGDILANFSDTFRVLRSDFDTTTNIETFKNSISLLQAIYIQQDFIQELHFIFKTGVSKGDLKKDLNYWINREIRNESVGHPIRKVKIENPETLYKSRLEKLKSSILFNFNSSPGYISYIKYERSNNFEFQEVSHCVDEILSRHYQFLDDNLNIILSKLKKILSHFYEEINKVRRVKSSANLENLTKVLSNSFEYIFKTDCLFNPQTLIALEQKKLVHPRYETALNDFYNELEIFISETRSSIKELIKDESYLPMCTPSGVNILVKRTRHVANNGNNYHYLLSKLNDKDSLHIIDFHIDRMLSICKGNAEAIAEINHMKSSIFDNLEYYSAYKHLKKILNFENGLNV